MIFHANLISSINFRERLVLVLRKLTVKMNRKICDCSRGIQTRSCASKLFRLSSLKVLFTYSPESLGKSLSQHINSTYKSAFTKKQAGQIVLAVINRHVNNNIMELETRETYEQRASESANDLNQRHSNENQFKYIVEIFNFILKVTTFNH